MADEKMFPYVSRDSDCIISMQRCISFPYSHSFQPSLLPIRISEQQRRGFLLRLSTPIMVPRCSWGSYFCLSGSGSGRKWSCRRFIRTVKSNVTPGLWTWRGRALGEYTVGSRSCSEDENTLSEGHIRFLFIYTPAMKMSYSLALICHITVSRFV